MVPSEQKLLNLLSNNDVTFYIPPYQRNYEWTAEQCQVFIDDVVKTYRANSKGHPSEHFFGSVTYFQNETPFGQPNKLVLIDGQQRITTSMLFLAALRDSADDASVVSLIDSRYLRNNNAVGDVEYKIKLKQVEADWQVYKHIMLREEIPAVEKDAAVYRNYSYFKKRIEEFKEEGYLFTDLIAKGLQKFSLITIELEPQRNEWENPQEIFESMNSLGKPLTLADLVRNYLLLGLAADRQDKLYNDYWLRIEKKLSGNISSYIRDYMQYHSRCWYKQATETNYKELYGIFKKTLSEYGSEEILRRLAQNAEIYSWLLPGGKTGENSIDKLLVDIQYLRITTAYSFLMGLLMKWKEKALDDAGLTEILGVFRIYCLRRRLLGLGAAENRVFPTLVNQIDMLVESPDKRQKMYEILSCQENRMRLPNDIELSKYLETANFYNFQYCKFILALVEEKITKSRPYLDDKALQIEHILPQKLTDEWKMELGPESETLHMELVNTIGNLTLIRHNQELGTKPFAEKRSVYENNTSMQIARQKITDKTKWNADAIRERSEWIIGFLLKEVLPIPAEMQKTNNFAAKERRGLSFEDLQLIGKEIDFIADPQITAKVVSDDEVEFEGQKYKLSQLTREIYTRKGRVSPSGSYRGAQHWAYEGQKLIDMM